MDTEELKDRFNYHAPPNEMVVETHGLIRRILLHPADIIQDRLPECRETSLALTKLEEAMFWANAAVARHHDHFTESPEE